MFNQRNQTTAPLGIFNPGEKVVSGPSLTQSLRRINRTLYLFSSGSEVKVMTGDSVTRNRAMDGQVFNGIILACPLESLGNPDFSQDHKIRYPYVGGSMAKGISSVNMVEALTKAGFLGFFGAAGLLVEEVESAIDQLQQRLPELNYGVNLIHSPNEPGLENALVDLYLRRNIKLVEASAFLDLSLALVRYRTHGIRRDHDGQIVAPNHVIGKISREEVAAKFFAPPPERFLRELVNSNQLTPQQAELASEIPMAQDVTVESDSGGHTDNRPALALFPTIQALSNSFQKKYNYKKPIRVGLGGGIATPHSAAAAFALGASYLVAGTVNQACIESGTCDEVRKMLAETRQADVIMAPSADMFEMGVNVQVIKRGTMFSMRATKLYELYRGYNRIEDIPMQERQKLEKSIFRKNFDQIWAETRTYFDQRDPRQVTKAEQDPKYKMALIFRWYLGHSAVWANQGVPDRKLDYQIWCGPAMGAFNEWAKGSFLEKVEHRRVVLVAMNILFGAAALTRANQLKLQGGKIEDETDLTRPLEIEQIEELLN